MGTDSIVFGTGTQPDSIRPAHYCAEVDEPDLGALVWANVQTLMGRAYGGDNITRLGRETGIKQGGAQRLKSRADVGIGLLQRIAKHFKIDAWQLLAPNLGESMRLSPEELDVIRKRREPIQPKGIVLSIAPTASPGGGIRLTAEQKRRAAKKKGKK